jgi:hypothetical protein
MSARIFNIVDASKGKAVRLRLQWVARLFHPVHPEPLSEIAVVSGFSRQRLHQLVQTTLRALSPCRPGPAAGSRRLRQLEQEAATLKRRVTALEAENRQLRGELANSVKIDEAFICRLIIILAVLPVSVRDMHRVLVAVVGVARAPSKSAISRRVQRFGKLARHLLDRARYEVADRVRSLLSDEIFYGHLPTLIAMESTSRAALAVERVQNRDKETWQCLLLDFPALKRNTADGGTAIVSATLSMGKSHQLDNFHEFRSFSHDIILKVEAATESALAYQYSWEPRLKNAGRAELKTYQAHFERAKAKVETLFDDLSRAQKAFALLRCAYEPRSSGGRLKTRKEADASITHAISLLEGGQHDLLKSAAKHMTTWRSHFTVYLEAFDDIPVLLTHNSRLTAREVLSLVSEHLHWQARLDDMAFWPDDIAWRSASRKAKHRLQILNKSCLNLALVTELLTRALSLLERSSSPLEALNLVVRKLQQLTQTPSDEQLALVVLDYDLMPRAPTHPSGSDSPFATLGVSFARGNRSLVDLLLEEAGLVPASKSSPAPHAAAVSSDLPDPREPSTRRLAVVRNQPSADSLSTQALNACDEVIGELRKVA